MTLYTLQASGAEAPASSQADASGVVQLSSFDYEVSARSEIAADVP